MSAAVMAADSLTAATPAADDTQSAASQAAADADRRDSQNADDSAVRVTMARQAIGAAYTKATPVPGAAHLSKTSQSSNTPAGHTTAHALQALRQSVEPVVDHAASNARQAARRPAAARSRAAYPFLPIAKTHASGAKQPAEEAFPIATAAVNSSPDEVLAKDAFASSIFFGPPLSNQSLGWLHT